ncbi:MAG: ATP-binding protein [Opitutaceae bacterium]|nr:ATP-binding protein [Opitutaceae bacterium]
MADIVPEQVDRSQPWPGLATFTEEHRAFFFGRDEETRELLRKIERRTLTVLFGQSGLGKSSLLQAGVFPRLRESGVWPIYVRLDHDPSASPLAEQIKSFVREGTAEAGTWSKPGSAIPSETLWEFFHHRDDVLTGKDGQPLIPMLVFDQFEELFTLGTANDASRTRAEDFIDQLSDLIENRPPADFDARIDSGTTNGDDFDHTRADYRILIALREDYLPHLESLKQRIPSLMQNRMRLTRLRGENALEAVLKPAPGVVSEEVARSIVAYVAGRADLDQAEVEPALLSLVCRELNSRRLAKGEAVISADLLEGSRETILTEFYERCVAPHPAAVREFIEDELLTDSGYRENIALERAHKGLASRGAEPKALDALVASRLLRIEERLDLRRIELTHDVLCAVVRASREKRRQRIEQEHEEQRRIDAEDALARSRNEAAEARRALFKARAIAAGAATLALVAIAAAAWGYLNMRRAQRAEKQALAAQGEANAAREAANIARDKAEDVMSFLLSDMQGKLVDNGDHQMSELMVNAMIGYYEGLPAGMIAGDSELNFARALASKARTSSVTGKAAEADAFANRAYAIIKQRIDRGNLTDKERRTANWVFLGQWWVAIDRNDFGKATAAASSAREIMEPLAKRENALASDVDSYIWRMATTAFSLQSSRQFGSAEPLFDQTIADAKKLGGGNPENRGVTYCMAAVYKGLSYVYSGTGRVAQGAQAARESIRLFDALAARWPEDMTIMFERGSSKSALGSAEWTLGNLEEARIQYSAAATEYTLYLEKSPNDHRVRMWALDNSSNEIDLALQIGHVDDALRRIEEVIRENRAMVESSQLAGSIGRVAWSALDTYARLGMRADAERMLALVGDFWGRMLDLAPEAFRAGFPSIHDVVEALRLSMELELGTDPGVVLERADKALKRVAELNPNTKPSFVWVELNQVRAFAALGVGSVRESEESATEALLGMERDEWYRSLNDYSGSRDRLQAARIEAQARQGRVAEAKGGLAPLLENSRARARAVPMDVYRSMRLLDFLVAKAWTLEPSDVGTKNAIRAEVSQLVSALPDRVKSMPFFANLQTRLDVALK